MKKKYIIILLILLFISVLVIYIYPIKKNNIYKQKLIKDIYQNTTIKDIKYLNKDNNYYIIIAEDKVVVLDLNYEEVYSIDKSKIKDNKKPLTYRRGNIYYEEKIKEKAIVELIQNPTEEIKKSVIEQIPVEQKENIIEEEIEIIKNELKKDPKFIQMCQNRAMSENEKLEELEMQIENLKGKKNYIEESIAELELHHKKQRKQLAEEFEKEKQINNARIIEMQNTTIEQEKDKPSFWNKIADKIFNFKIVATVSFVMYQLSNKVPPERILKNVKHFRKNYDKYVENPELIQRELKIMEYMDIGLSKIEESEKIDLNKEKSRDDYDLEL